MKGGHEVGFKVSDVVRLEGTNVAQAREILSAAKAVLPTYLNRRDGSDGCGEEDGGGGGVKVSRCGRFSSNKNPFKRPPER